MLHILISGQHWNNRVTESDEWLNEIRHTCKTNLDAQIVQFIILFAKKKKATQYTLLLLLGPSFKSRDWIWQENATVEFSIVVLKIIFVTCVHRFYIQNHTQPSLFCETENFTAISWLTIGRRFSYDYDSR